MGPMGKGSLLESLSPPLLGWARSTWRPSRSRRQRPRPVRQRGSCSLRQQASNISLGFGGPHFNTFCGTGYLKGTILYFPLWLLQSRVLSVCECFLALKSHQNAELFEGLGCRIYGVRSRHKSLLEPLARTPKPSNPLSLPRAHTHVDQALNLGFGVPYLKTFFLNEPL